MNGLLVDLWHEERAKFVPRESPLSVLLWCTMLVLPGSRKGQRYDPTIHPGQYEFLRAYEGAKYTDFVVIGPTQDGKTVTVCLVPLLHQLIEVGDNAVYGLPDENVGLRQWTEKVEPAMRLSGLDARMPTHGVGSAGGATRVTIMQFNDGGLLTWMGGGSKNESAQSSVSAPVVVKDEIDAMKVGIVEKMDRRADAFDSIGKARRISTSTIKHDDGTSKVLGLYSQSTAARLYFPCPACRQFQSLEWERVEYDPTDDISARDTAVLRCANDSCGHAWTDEERLMALRDRRLVMRGQAVDPDGTVIGDAPRTILWGLMWTALDSPFRTLGRLALLHRKAKEAVETRGDHEEMRQFYRDQLCRVYLGDRLDQEDGVPSKLTRGHLVARSAASVYGPTRDIKGGDGADGYHIAPCPAEVAWMTAACDVQRGGRDAPGRLYFLLQGMDTAMRTWDLAWGSLSVSPIGTQANTEEMHRGLDRLDSLLRELQEEMGRPLVRRAVDVGDRQDELRQWLIKNREWWPIKGTDPMKSADQWDLSGWIYRRLQKDRWYLYHIDTKLVRRQAQAGFLLAPGKVGAAHVPRGLRVTSALVRHYCATAEVPDARGGLRWTDRETDRKLHPDYARRHDLLDCRTYAIAVGYEYLRRQMQNRGRPTNYGAIGGIT